MLGVIDRPYEETESPSSYPKLIKYGSKVNTHTHANVSPHPTFANLPPLSPDVLARWQNSLLPEALSSSGSTNGLFKITFVISENLTTGFAEFGSKYIQALHGPTELDDTLEKITDLPRLARQSTLVTNDIALDTLKLAEKFIKRMYYAAIKNSCDWKTPHISFDDNEGITFEWWYNNRVLTIFVTLANTIEYQRAWGPDIWEEMDEGENPSNQQLESLWQWICAPNKTINQK